MNIKDFAWLLKKRERELVMLMTRTLPVKAGRMATDHFRDNFRLGGFVDTGLQKWQPAKRILSGGTGAGSKYGTLLSRRNRLFDSIRATTSPGRAVVSTAVTYAAIHNEGGTVHPRVTPHMRAYAWFRFYKASGKRRGNPSPGSRSRRSGADENPQAAFWKRMALTKKSNLSIRIPKRQFIGPSRKLDTMISEMVEAELRKLLNL